MKQFLMVFIGGGLGCTLRYIMGKTIHPYNGYPVSTFFVNIIGCLLIGFLMEYGLKSNFLNENHSIFLITGFCGGFTTFSAFAAENQVFLKSSDYVSFGIYSLGSIAIGIFGIIIGAFLAKQL